jgi:hypothetical protein
MGGIEKTIEVRKEELLPKVSWYSSTLLAWISYFHLTFLQVPAILKTFYDEDILEEEILLEWGKKVSRKYVTKELSEQIHKKAESFLKW